MATKTYKLTHNKSLNLYYYKELGLVVKSDTEKYVIGRLENKEFIPFDDKTLELCDQYGLEPDPSKIEQVENSSEEKDEKDEEKENEKQETDEEGSNENKEIVVKQEKEKIEVKPIQQIEKNAEKTEKEKEKDKQIESKEAIHPLLLDVQKLFNSLNKKVSELETTVSSLETERSKLLLEVTDYKNKMSQFLSMVNSLKPS